MADDAIARSHQQFGNIVEAPAHGNRRPLPGRLRNSLTRHVAGLRSVDLTRYTYERTTSLSSGARWDLVVYDPSGTVAAKGRQFDDGQAAFWEA